MELAAFEQQQPRYSQWDSALNGYFEPDASRARRENLRASIYRSEMDAENWLRALGAYVAIVIGGGVIVLFCLAARDLILAVEKSRADRQPNAEPLSQKISSAVSKARQAMPRQPTLGGGRLSTADELRKWSNLRDEGLVSEEEFTKMREKLLG